ncbi:MAG: hypothetical protein ACLFWD_10065 [Anaerolineales bacterium]
MTERPQAPKPTPAERLTRLEREYRGLESKVVLAEIKDRVEDLESNVNGTLQQVKDLRNKGYLYEPDLEERALELRKQWAKLRPGLAKEVDDQRGRLEKAKKPVDVMIRGARAGGVTQAKAVDKLEAGLGDLEAEYRTAEKSIQGMYDGFSSRLSKLRSHLQEVKWMMEQGAESAFDWLPNEGILRAVSANWVRNQEDEPRGVLFLTDQRILFERKETVATKKVLFITTEKEKIQKPLLEIALPSIRQTKAENKGLMGHEDHLYLECDSEAPLPRVHFHLDGQDCELWARKIQRAIRGEFDDQRIEPISEEEEARLQNAPTKCSACGATFSSPILRGQRELACSYCGSVERL